MIEIAATGIALRFAPAHGLIAEMRVTEGTRRDPPREAGFL